MMFDDENDDVILMLLSGCIDPTDPLGTNDSDEDDLDAESEDEPPPPPKKVVKRRKKKTDE